MLASASDYHTFHKFKPGGRNQAAQTYLEAVKITVEAGIRPRLHLEDATRAPMDFMQPIIEAVQEIAAPYGPDLRPKFRVCDTMGLGLPFEDVALPRSVPRIFRVLRSMGLDSADLEFHPHNDTWLIVANCLAAVREGCAVINGTSLGKGERTGNAPLEAILMHLMGMGYFAESQPDFTVLNDLAALYGTMGEPVPSRYPLYGRDAHRTRAGIHADGLNKFWWMYAPFDVPRLLGRPLEVSLTKDSGIAGLIFLIHQHLNMEVSKDSPGLLRIYEWMLAEFDGGRQTSIEWEELEPIVKKQLLDVVKA
jgi:isopropylmalate/homocitrate/citramalate synthase